MTMLKSEKESMARRTDIGIGAYRDTVSCKLANSDISTQEAAELTDIDASTLTGWNWDDHDMLMDDLGEPEVHRIANLPIL